MTSDTLTIVLAGKVGEGLHPLSDKRAKSAIPFGGKYRLIDFSLTNCLHSGLRRILVMTQYKSHSLHKHLRDGWSVFNPELGEYITAVPPQISADEEWTAGTAHAIYQNLHLLERSKAKWVLLLQGDHIYRMDYEPLIRAHADSGSEVTIVTREVKKGSTGSYRIVKFDKDLRITDSIDPSKSTNDDETQHEPVQSSIGVYIFSIDALMKSITAALSNSSNPSIDFEKEIIDGMVSKGSASAYLFGSEAGRVTQDKYWRDISTIDEYYLANMELLKPTPSIDLYQKDWPIRTYSGQYPPARNSPGQLGHEGISVNSIASTGSVICGGKVQGSILFNGAFIGEESFIENSIIFEGVTVGEGAMLRNCIIDKGVVIPDGEVIGHDEKADKNRFMITTGGVVVIPKNFCF